MTNEIPNLPQSFDVKDNHPQDTITDKLKYYTHLAIEIDKGLSVILESSDVCIHCKEKLKISRDFTYLIVDQLTQLTNTNH